ncbi:LytTR family transcriptional regulator [Variovorax sp. ZS18.2.2]|uniref:LytTR family DNA-binding domain-containing protein n=1 Tax=Variovorax sp. ZS18.2.2 TaxID=2971255 RepID=UPI002151C45D|nr:LytTR family DNA-binding domain-containing protein [Variovorax sp. ZS18.2.2]MCR6476863.1 LytTR family transcriptional regulator [Variovorax sp. ZS18.2.2]
MKASHRNLYERYEPIRRYVEVGFWIVLMALQGVFSTMVAAVDARARAVPRATWEIVTWEGSSHLVLLMLIPVFVAIERRLAPLMPGRWVRFVAGHVAASVAISVVHVAGMFAVRSLVYALMGSRYDFGGWTGQWGYEYLKDVRVYISIVFGIWAYRLFMLRLQGEARVLDAPEAGVSDPPETAPLPSSPAPDDAPPEPEASPPPLPPPPTRPERFLVRKLRREFLIAATDIDWLQAEGNYVGLHVNGHDYLLRATLTDFLTQLDPARFVRVHRSHAVNLARIKEIEPLDGGDARLHMHDGTTVPCSRRYRDALRAGAG